MTNEHPLLEQASKTIRSCLEGLAQFPMRPASPCILESPFRAEDEGQHATHVLYARWLMVQLMCMGYAPIASHLLYTLMLDDANEPSRARAIQCGLDLADALGDVPVFLGAEYGVSDGMELAIEHHRMRGRDIEHLPMFAEFLDCVRYGIAPPSSLQVRE